MPLKKNKSGHYQPYDEKGRGGRIMTNIDVKSYSQAMLLYYFYKDKKPKRKYDLSFFEKIRSSVLIPLDNWTIYELDMFEATEEEFEIYKNGLLECLGDDVPKNFFKETHYPLVVRWAIDSRYNHLKGKAKENGSV